MPLSFRKYFYPARGIILASGFQITISFAWIVWYAWTFRFAGKRLVALHLSLIVCLLFVTFVSLGLLRRLFPGISRGWVRATVFVIMAGETASLMIVYVGDTISSLYANGCLPWTGFLNYVFSLTLLRADIPAVETWALPVAFMILAAAVVPNAWLAPRIAEALDSLFLDGHDCSLFDGRRRTSATLTAIAAFILGMTFALLAITFYIFNGWLQLNDRWLPNTTMAAYQRLRLVRQEPILALFTSGAALGNLEDYRFRLRLARDEPAVRASYPRQQTFEHRNVILITVDSLRPDHMQVYGYGRQTTPFLEELKQAGRLRLVDRAVATCPESICGISSILTSKCRGYVVPQNFSLHKLLHDQGYDVHFVLVDDHNYGGLREVYGDSLTSYFDGASAKQYSSTDDRLIFEGLTGVPAYQGTPTFFYFHLMSTHHCGIQQAAFQKYLPAHKWNLVGTPDRSDRVAMINAYDNGVLQADWNIRGIFEWLDRSGYLDSALVVITADHGEGLGEHGYHHGFELNQEAVSVPLAFYDRAEFDYGALTFARQIDIAPTILARLGLSVPSSWQGHSLLDSSPPRYALVQRSVRTAVRAGADEANVGSIFYWTGLKTYQYIRDSSTTWDVKEELYDLSEDPFEKENIVGTAEASLVEHLREKFSQFATFDRQCDAAAGHSGIK